MSKGTGRTRRALLGARAISMALIMALVMPYLAPIAAYADTESLTSEEQAAEGPMNGENAAAAEESNQNSMEEEAAQPDRDEAAVVATEEEESDEAPVIPADTSSDAVGASEAPEAPDADDIVLQPAATIEPSPITTVGNPEDYPGNALGFYQWLGDTEAYDAFYDTVYKGQKNGSPDYTQRVQDFTDIGAPDDATGLENMKKALDLLAEGQQLHTTDPNAPGLDEWLVSSYHMAIAQLHCNWEAQEYDHVRAYNVGENLHSTVKDPYEGWYWKEKPNYEAAMAGTPNGGQTGHYANIINSSYKVTGIACTQTEEGYIVPGKYEPYTWTQVFDSRVSQGKNYSYTDYHGAFMQFYEAHTNSLGSATVEPISSYVYDGLSKTPEPVVKLRSTTLQKGVDYQLSYADNRDAGTATVTITGIGNYFGSTTATFVIEPVTISGAEVTGIIGKTYPEYTQAPTVLVEGRTLKMGSDYTLSYADHNSTGTATVIISGTGNYKDSVSRTFEITPLDIFYAEVNGVEDKNYDGTPQTQEPELYFSRTLEEGVDYTLSYENNIEAGTATMIITGIGNCFGMQRVEFRIGRHIGAATVTGIVDKTYNGSPHTQEFTVELDGRTLVEGEDYTVHTYEGTIGKVPVTISGIGNYVGEKELFYTIHPAVISDETATVEGVVDKGYTGSPRTLGLTVIVDGRTLAPSDYTATYKNNVNIGTATVTIQGKTNYTGSITRSFQITAPSIQDAAIGGIQQKTYDGNAQTQNLTVKHGGKTLAEGTDYTVSYANNINAGTAELTVTGIGQYIGERTLSFRINAASLSGAEISGVTDRVYNGKLQTQSPTVSIGGKTLVAESDYILAYSANYNAGTATVYAYGRGNYSGSAKKTFTIKPLDISDVSISVPDYEYTGFPQTPLPKITVGEYTLQTPYDFEASYENNTEIGTATLTITGVRNCTGSISTTFQIKKSLGPAVVDGVVRKTYDGTPQLQSPTVTYKGSPLTEGIDYELVYTNNINAGNYSARLEIVGIGEFLGKKTFMFTIQPANISGASVAGVENRTYDGSEQLQSPVITMAGRTLVEGEDYQLAYAGNIDAGTATMTISGIGNYSSTKRIQFQIAKASVAGAAIEGVTSKQYNGEEQTQNPSVVLGGRTLVMGDDYELSYANNIEPGTATVTVTGKGNYTGEKTVEFAIIRSIEAAAVKGIEDKTYDGSEQKQAITVSLGGKALIEGTDYTVSYRDNVEPGVATMTITGIGAYTGEKSVTFRIGRSIADAEVSGVTERVYNGTSQTQQPTIRVGEKVLAEGDDYTLSYSNNTDAGEATMVIKGAGDYIDELPINFLIRPALLEEATVEGIIDRSYDGSPQTQQLEVSLAGRKLIEGSDYTLSYSENVAATESALVVIEGIGNYQGRIERTFTISQASLSRAEITGVVSRTYDGTEQTQTANVTMGGRTLEEGTDYRVVYENNVNAGMAKMTVMGIGSYEGSISTEFEIVPAQITQDNVTHSDIEPELYYGGTRNPNPQIFIDGELIHRYSDYQLSYKDNIDAGNATITVSGIGNYTGTATIQFTILPAPIAKAVLGSVAPYVYDGTAKEPQPELTLDGRALVLGTDYALSYSNNTKAGTATVKAAGKGNYEGSVTGTFTIARASLSNAEVTGSTVTFNGAAQTPSVTVKLGDAVLAVGTDYTVDYSDNVNAGTATVTVTGKGNYTDSATGTFLIKKLSVGGAEVSEIPDQVVDGTEKRPVPTVTLNGKTLVHGTDYYMHYSNNVEAGTAHAWVYGTGNYYGAIPGTFTIKKGSINDAEITIPSFTYDGTNKTPDPTIVFDGRTLVRGTDYTLIYPSSIKAGTYSLEIFGKGNWGGYLRTSYTVEKASLANAKVIALNQTYSHAPKTPYVTVMIDGATVLPSNYSVSYSNNVNAGTATVTVVGKENYRGTAIGTFTIEPASLSGAQVTAPDQTYSGAEKRPSPTVTIGGITLSPSDYSVSYTDNVKAGTARVTVTGKGNYTGTASGTFAINSAPTLVPIYRMYNVRTSEHLWTTSRAEYRACGRGGYADWRQEGIAWYAPKRSDRAVHRLYNPGLGDHHYSSSEAEIAQLTQRHGWKDEGIAFYSADRSDPAAMEIYRVYNGRLKRGQHHYTTSSGERAALTTQHGWRDEGVSFYGYSANYATYN